MTTAGPSPQGRARRLAQIERFVGLLEQRYPGGVNAVAAYGSFARGEDGPFSDIELYCLVEPPDVEENLEWVYGAGKAEINIYGSTVARERASRVESDWAVSQGQFAHARCMAGDPHLIEELKGIVLSASDEQIVAAVVETTVGELYEWIGKLRNASYDTHFASVPSLACRFAEQVAQILGLVYRRIYRNGGYLLEESLRLPGLPDGYERLCRKVMSGRLHETEGVIAAVEAAFGGVVDWESGRGIEVPTLPWPE